MKDYKIKIEAIEDLVNRPDLLKPLMETLEISQEDFDEMDTLEQIIDLICEYGDYDEEVDSCYITRDYTCESEDGKFEYECSGSSYRKDQCVCDEQMDYECFLIIDNEAKKMAKKAKKAPKKEKAKSESDKKWDEFFSNFLNCGKDDMVSELKKYKFPTKL